MSSRTGFWATLFVTFAGAAALAPFALASSTPAAVGKDDPHAWLADFRRPSTVPAPRDNPMTPEKVALGQKLFFDPRLSGSGVISCSTCHNPALGWEDALPKGRGNM